MYTYQPQGVCSKLMTFDIVDGKVHNLSIIGGCPGNLPGIAKLIEGMDAKDAISRLEGISCAGKPTSCPDQIAQALKQALAEQHNSK